MKIEMNKLLRQHSIESGCHCHDPIINWEWVGQQILWYRNRGSYFYHRGVLINAEYFYDVI